MAGLAALAGVSEEPVRQWERGRCPRRSTMEAIAMILVGLFSLMMLRSMLKGSQVAPTPSPQDAAHTAPVNHAADDAHEESENEPASVKMPRRRFKSSGPTLRDELREIVKEDPDAAATVLRAWIGDAA